MKEIDEQIKQSLISKEDSYIFQILNKRNPEDIWNIVIIDDSEKDIELFEEILQSEKVVEFFLSKYQDPQKAIFDLGKQFMDPPDLIILDLEMPSLSGKQILQDIKDIATLKSIAVIVYSSANNYKNIIESRNFGAHAFFTKPLNIKLFEKFLFSKSNKTSS